MRIAEGVHEIAGFEAAYLRHHQREQGIGGDVERYAEENVGAALVELAGQFAVRDVELEERMAGCERHLVELADVPGRDDQAARIGVLLDLRDDFGNLVHRAPVRRGPRAPLLAVHRAEVALLVRPFVPDRHAVFLEVADVGVALQEPQQFVDDGLQVAFLGGDQREALCEVEAHLVAEHADRAGAGAVGFFRAVFQHVLHEIEIGSHKVKTFLSADYTDLHRLKSLSLRLIKACNSGLNLRQSA